jgi:ribosomal protein S18 acetylase RimI-like enzyme
LTASEVTFIQNSAGVDIVFDFLHQSSQDNLYLLQDPRNLRTYTLKLLRYAERYEAWSNGRLIGLVAAYQNDAALGRAFISHVSVVSNFWGRGIARNLLSACIEHSIDLGMQRLELEVRVDNQPARTLYESLGFEVISRSSERKHGVVSYELRL